MRFRKLNDFCYFPISRKIINVKNRITLKGRFCETHREFWSEPDEGLIFCLLYTSAEVTKIRGKDDDDTAFNFSKDVSTGSVKKAGIGEWGWQEAAISLTVSSVPSVSMLSTFNINFFLLLKILFNTYWFSSAI